MTVLKFPKRGHARSTSKPNNDGLGFFRSLESACLNTTNFLDGMRPRDRQLLTAGRPTPQREATTAVPPNESTISSTVINMTPDYSRNVNKSSSHGMEIVTDCEFRPNSRMATARKDIVKRLKTLPDALGVTAAELCRRIGCKPNAWSQYVSEDGKRKITLTVANHLCDEFKLSLDWIYRGDTSGLQGRLIEKLRRAA